MIYKRILSKRKKCAICEHAFARQYEMSHLKEGHVCDGCFKKFQEEVMINNVTTFFKCKEDELNPFEVQDSFNPQNVLKGFLCRIRDHRYGALYITHVNGEETDPQIVYGTPKLHYPFDKNGVFKWPAYKYVNVYEKIDGTNIVGYAYHNASGHIFITYKTRMTPVLKEGSFGSFVSMWKEMLVKYPLIPVYISDERSLSFELYGSKNLHLIVYDTPLDIALLFGVTRPTDSSDPEVIDLQSIMTTLPKVAGSYLSKSDLTEVYQAYREAVEAKNSETEMGIKGSEGKIFYVHMQDGSIRMYKCKPPSVEKVHWSAGGIGTNEVRAACLKAFENFEEPEVKDVREILKEDYKQELIEKASKKIDRVLGGVYFEMKFRGKVLDLYKQSGLNIVEDKAGVMRHLSQYFPGKQMRTVFWVIDNCAS